MKHKDYWRKRFKQLEESQNKKGQQCYAEIEKQYHRAQKEIEGKIAAWYQRFAVNNEISLQEARKLLRGRELAEFKWDVNDYIRYGEENTMTQQWMKELENASARYHISRLEAIKLHIQQSLEVLFGNQLDALDSVMRSIYTDGYYRTAYEIHKGLGVGWEFAALDEKTISKVIKKPWAADGKNFSERVWGNRKKLVNELNQALVQNMILGQNPQKAIDTIARKMKVSKNNAGRLVMTEEAFFSSVAQKDCFHELGVEQYEIVATLDSKTSPLCRQMDGQCFPMSQYEVGVTAPPFHVYCRTTTAPFFDDDLDMSGERIACDTDGKSYYVPSNMTYRQWENTFVDDKSTIGSNLKRPPDYDLQFNGQKLDADLYKQAAQNILERGYDYSAKSIVEMVDSVYTYTQTNYTHILAAQNNFKGRFANYSFILSDSDKMKAQQDADNIERFLKISPTYSGAVYRGLGFDVGGPYDTGAYNEFRALYKKGNVLETDTLTSWTKEESVLNQIHSARTFIDEEAEYSVEVTIRLPNCVSGVDISAYADLQAQKEVLFGKGTAIRINNVTENWKNDELLQVVIDVEEV